MSCTRTLVAITSLCSLALLSSCGPSQSTADCAKSGTCLPNPDGSQPVDVAMVPDAIADLGNGSPDATPLDGSLDHAADRGDVAEAGADGPAPALDGNGTDTPDAGTDASVDETASDDAGNTPADAYQGDATLDGTCAINGRPAPAGMVCRVSSGPCDVVETCDGLSTVCPLDRFLAKGEVCRPKAGDCDREETCSGTSADCPADIFLAKGATCRAAVSDLCDVAEYCAGTGPACPVDQFGPAGVLCRASTDGDVCDPPEYCTGKSNQCPLDVTFTAPTSAPTGVAVTPGDRLVDVSWNPVAGVSGYNVKSSTISGTGFAVRGSPSKSPFTVTSLNATQTFYFVVSTYSGQPTCESPNSSQVSALSCASPAPTDLAAVVDAAGQVTLSWTAPTGTVASYTVSRSTTSGSGYALIPGAEALAATTFIDSPAVLAGGSATFYYVVRANTGTCLSAYSTQAIAVFGSPDAGAATDAAVEDAPVADDGGVADDAGADAPAVTD